MNIIALANKYCRNSSIVGTWLVAMCCGSMTMKLTMLSLLLYLKLQVLAEIQAFDNYVERQSRLSLCMRESDTVPPSRISSRLLDRDRW